MLHEVSGHVLQPAGHVDADPIHLAVARRARPGPGRHLDRMHVAFDAARAPAWFRLARVSPAGGRARRGLLGVRDRAIQLGVRVGFRLQIDRGVDTALPDDRVEQQRDLPGVDALRVTADPFAPQFGDEQARGPDS